MYSDSRLEGLKHDESIHEDDEPLMVDGLAHQSVGARNRAKMLAAVLVLAGVVVGAVVTSQGAVPENSMEENLEPHQKWECVHWTPTDNMARRANANERRLCENKGNHDSNFQYVYKPFGLTCQGGCHCCTRKRWSCARWTRTDLRARESNADERMLCENKQTALIMYKYKPNGKTCGNGGGCLCCSRTISNAVAALTGPTTLLDTATCSKIQVTGAADDIKGDYSVNAACPAAVKAKAEPLTKIYSKDPACTYIIYRPKTKSTWSLVKPKVGAGTGTDAEATWTSKAQTPAPTTTAAKNKFLVEGGAFTPAGRVLPLFACSA